MLNGEAVLSHIYVIMYTYHLLERSVIEVRLCHVQGLGRLRGLGLQVKGMMLNSMRLEPMFSSFVLQRCRGCLPPMASSS